MSEEPLNIKNSRSIQLKEQSIIQHPQTIHGRQKMYSGRRLLCISNRGHFFIPWWGKKKTQSLKPWRFPEGNLKMKLWLRSWGQGHCWGGGARIRTPWLRKALLSTLDSAPLLSKSTWKLQSYWKILKNSFLTFVLASPICGFLKGCQVWGAWDELGDCNWHRDPVAFFNFSFCIRV